MKGRTDPLEEAVALRRAGGRGALCTVTRISGSVPAREAMRMLVRGDGSIVGTVGGGRFEEESRRAALETMDDERCRTMAFELTEDDEAEPGLVCGGRLEVFVEPLTVPRLLVFGAGHLGATVARSAALVGFHVTVVDDRATHARADRLPGAAEVMALPWDEAFARLEADAATWVLVMTRTCAMDERCLRWACGTDARFLGMIGSTRKAAKVRERLLALGVHAERLDAVRCPVGLAIGARTHEEIAVSIVAQLIAERRGAGGEGGEGNRVESAVPDSPRVRRGRPASAGRSG